MIRSLFAEEEPALGPCCKDVVAEKHRELLPCACGVNLPQTMKNTNRDSVEFGAVWIECPGCGFKTWSHLCFRDADAVQAATEEWNKKQGP